MHTETLLPVRKNNHAIVDFDLYQKYKSFTWWLSTHGYAKTDVYKNGKRRTVFLHQEIMGKKEGFEIDHINGNRLDNRRENLRFVTRSQNNMNARKRGNTTSKYKGVSFHKERKKWRAYIFVRNKQISLGLFDNERDAALAYNTRANIEFGEYARLNVI